MKHVLHIAMKTREYDILWTAVGKRNKIAQSILLKNWYKKENSYLDKWAQDLFLTALDFIQSIQNLL